MTASSQWDANHAAWLARLHRTRRGRLMGAWSSRHNNHNQWLQIYLSTWMKVVGIATQGRHDADQWVTAYYVYYSSDGVNFAKVKHWWNYVKVKFYSSCFHKIRGVFVVWKFVKFFIQKLLNVKGCNILNIIFSVNFRRLRVAG